MTYNVFGGTLSYSINQSIEAGERDGKGNEWEKKRRQVIEVRENTALPLEINFWSRPWLDVDCRHVCFMWLYVEGV